MPEIEARGFIKHKRSFVLTEKTCRYAGAAFLTLGVIGFALFLWVYSCISGGTDFPVKFVIGEAIFQSIGFIVFGFIFYMLSHAFTALIEEIELTV